MADRNRRDKAMDVFNKTNFLLGDKTSSFSKAFPKIQTLRVKVVADGEGVTKYNREESYTEKRPPGEYINCHNPRCYNGGFRIAQSIRFMVERKQLRESFTEHCQGYEGSPKGRKKYGPCDNVFHVEIELKLEEEKET